MLLLFVLRHLQAVLQWLLLLVLLHSQIHLVVESAVLLVAALWWSQGARGACADRQQPRSVGAVLLGMKPARARHPQAALGWRSFAASCELFKKIYLFFSERAKNIFCIQIIFLPFKTNFKVLTIPPRDSFLFLSVGAVVHGSRQAEIVTCFGRTTTTRWTTGP